MTPYSIESKNRKAEESGLRYSPPFPADFTKRLSSDSLGRPTDNLELHQS